MMILGCGNCVYYAMWHRFPPTSSWVVIVPLWFIVLSVIGPSTSMRLRAIPPVYVAIPLVLAVVFFAPGVIGPPLGFWIPICCIVGTVSGLSKLQSPKTRKVVLGITVAAVVALVGFGTCDVVADNRMLAAEKERYLPAWEATGKVNPHRIPAP